MNNTDRTFNYIGHMDIDMSPLSKGLIIADDICDYIPFLSTLTNLIDIIGKCLLKIASLDEKTGEALGKSHYFKHLRDEKSLLFCIKLLIPFLNIYFKFNKGDDTPIDLTTKDYTNKFKELECGETIPYSTETLTTQQIRHAAAKEKIQDEFTDKFTVTFNEIKKENNERVKKLEKTLEDLPKDSPEAEKKRQQVELMKGLIKNQEESILKYSRKQD